MTTKGIIRNYNKEATLTTPLPHREGLGVGLLLRFYLLTVMLFMAAKVVFMVVCHEGQAPFTAADVWQVLRHGLSLDLSTALYLLIVPFLLTAASVWVRVPRWIFSVYYAVVAVALALAFVADTSLYPFWQFKLDASCLQYLSNPTEAMASVSTGYLLVRLVVIVVAAVVFFWLFRFAGIPAFRDSGIPRLRHSGIPVFRDSVVPGSLKRRLAATLFFLLCIPFIVIGIRGGLSESTTNIGQVYFSQNQFLNHSAVNPVFSFLSSISKSGDYIVSYDYFDDDELARLTDGLFDTQSVDPDTLLTTPRPNILIILMESCGGQFTELGGHPEITPRLNRLCHEGVYFTECYANSWRTDRGVISTLSGYPSFPMVSVMKIPEKSRKLPSIAASLKAEGYTTAFYHGGDINFTNMRSYVVGSGYEQLRWKADYPREQQSSAQWGVRDDLMFSSLLSDIEHETSARWMKTLLTLSSHEPWDVPDVVLDDKVYNAFHYLDHCLGTFIDSLRLTPQWQNLLVVILPDHGVRYRDINETTRLYNHIPMIWLGGAVKSARRVELVCNQSDLPATLLGQMGLPHDDFTFSRDVVSRNYCRPMAYHTFVNGMTLIDSVSFMAYDLDANSYVAYEGITPKDSLLERSKALLQLTSHDLINK